MKSQPNLRSQRLWSVHCSFFRTIVHVSLYTCSNVTNLQCRYLEPNLFLSLLFYIQMDQFLSGYNVQQTVANRKQSPSLIQTSVPSSATNKEAESKPAVSKV